MEKAIVHAANAVEFGERRRSKRVDLLVRVTYQTVDELFSEFARNINEGGIFIETDTPQEPGSAGTLQFKLPGSDELIEVMGTVVRSEEGSESNESPGMGIEFGDLNASSRQHIDEIIRRLRANG
jgi:type IV pilus assembly protein PilZ